jgi:CubicO group peptidase (beta-lactamase class C family)
MSTSFSSSLERTADEIDFSGVVHVERGGIVMYERASGLADRAHGIPNTIDTQFGIASGVKGFTALTVMSLVADGSLSLDMSVRNVLGDDLELIDAAVTVEHLLAHTSGIGDYLDESLLGDVDDYVMSVPVHQLASTADYLSVLRGHPMTFTPGAQFEYCNGGYVVLALVVEAVTAASFYDVVEERVLIPAGMSSTAFLRSDELPGSAALGYVHHDGGWRTNQLHLPLRGSGDGGAYSTVGDFKRFWASLFSGRILPLAVVDEMVRAHNETKSRRYGLGFWLRPDRETVMLEGSDAGVSFRSAYDPTSELLYTVISNTSTGAWPLVKLLDGILPELAT